jgi:hypothetical protein
VYAYYTVCIPVLTAAMQQHIKIIYELF